MSCHVARTSLGSDSIGLDSIGDPGREFYSCLVCYEKLLSLARGPLASGTWEKTVYRVHSDRLSEVGF